MVGRPLQQIPAANPFADDPTNNLDALDPVRPTESPGDYEPSVDLNLLRNSGGLRPISPQVRVPIASLHNDDNHSPPRYLTGSYPSSGYVLGDSSDGHKS